MPKMDDYYAKVASATPKSKRMLDVVPNGEDFRGRIYGAHLRNHNDGLPRQDGEPSINAGSTAQMFVVLGKRNVSCPECNAEPGQPCRGIADNNRGQELNGLHAKRISMARRMYGRKKA